MGVIPSGQKTFEVGGDFNTPDKVEGCLYYNPDTKRLYYYSTKQTRSCPENGYFPIWNGNRMFETPFSNCKYLSDATTMDVDSLASHITSDVAKMIIYNQRKSENDELLKPAICDGDNMFTQCVKGVICAMNITMVDLVDMSSPQLDEKIVENYYNSLTKITFMRLDKWKIWISTILHVSYVLDVYDGDNILISYAYPADTYDTGVVKYDSIINAKADPFKKIINVVSVIKGITKSSLKTDEVDSYSINNLYTTINSNKPLSAQLFARFIKMAKLGYKIRIYSSDNNLLFEYKEGNI